MRASAPRPPFHAGSGAPQGRRAGGLRPGVLGALRRRILNTAILTGAILLGALMPAAILSAAPVTQAAAADGQGTSAPAQAVGPAFDRLVRAWRAGSAPAVVRVMDPHRTTRFTLLGYPLSGKTCSMKPKQARASLKAYFHRIRGIQLKDVTPRNSPASVRLYDFTYTPAREDVRTTRLHLQLTRNRKGPWVLTSVTESAKPRD